MHFFGNYPYSFGYGYGYGPRWGYNPYFTIPILQTENKLSGLYNEYNELNDLSARNNSIYFQNMLENNRYSKYYNRELPLQKPSFYYPFY